MYLINNKYEKKIQPLMAQESGFICHIVVLGQGDVSVNPIISPHNDPHLSPD